MTRMKTLILSLSAVAMVALAVPRPAQALTALGLREDGGAIVVVASGPSLTALSFSWSFPVGQLPGHQFWHQ